MMYIYMILGLELGEVVYLHKDNRDNLYISAHMHIALVPCLSETHCIIYFILQALYFTDCLFST